MMLCDAIHNYIHTPTSTSSFMYVQMYVILLYGFYGTIQQQSTSSTFLLLPEMNKTRPNTARLGVCHTVAPPQRTAQARVVSWGGACYNSTQASNHTCSTAKHPPACCAGCGCCWLVVGSFPRVTRT